MSGMKGMELPINMIVVVAIAVLVLVVTAGFFGGFLTGNINSIELEQAYNSACSQLRNTKNCVARETASIEVQIKVPGETVIQKTNLLKLCEKLNKGADSTGVTCARSCGCQIPE